MILIILSIIFGIIGFTIGSLLGAPIYAYFLGIIGVLSPGLYALEQIYRKIIYKSDSE